MFSFPQKIKVNMKRKILSIIDKLGYEIHKKNKQLPIISSKPINVGGENVLTRESWLEKTLKTIEEGKTILDAGAGELQYKKFCDHLNYISQDFGQYDGKGDKIGKQTGEWDNSKLDIVSDILSIPLDANSVDAIMCIEVFEHIPDPIRATQELIRILKPGGHIIITAPFASLTHFSPYHFYTGFNRYFYEFLANTYGIEILDLTPNGSFYDFLAQENYRLKKVSKQYSNVDISNEEFRNVLELRKTLQTLKDADTKSSELLCFGYHFLGRKI